MGNKVARAYPSSTGAHQLTDIRVNTLTVFKEVRWVLVKRMTMVLIKGRLSLTQINVYILTYVNN